MGWWPPWAVTTAVLPKPAGWTRSAVNHGTLPIDDLYFALKPLSSNQGAVDYDALIAGVPQPALHKPAQAGGFALFRIGDAVSARNTHAAIYDVAAPGQRLASPPMKLSRLFQPRNPLFWTMVVLNLPSAALAWVSHTVPLGAFASLVVAVFALGNAVLGTLLAWRLVNS